MPFNSTDLAQFNNFLSKKSIRGKEKIREIEEMFTEQNMEYFFTKYVR